MCSKVFFIGLILNLCFNSIDSIVSPNFNFEFDENNEIFQKKAKELNESSDAVINGLANLKQLLLSKKIQQFKVSAV